MTRPPLPVWRSMLFVPVLNERFVSGAARRGADAIQLDLEDSIPPDRKDAARARVSGAAEELAQAGCEVVVRINRPWRAAVRDLEASVSPAVSAINLPKVPNAEHVRAIAEILEELELSRGLAAGHTRLVLMVETAEGLINLAPIAAASPRVVAITVGAEDLSVSMGMEPEAEALYLPNMQVVAAARAAGVLPIGYIGTVAQFGDREAFTRVARQARRLGFTGGFCIHPDQVDILNLAFSPTAAEIEAAEAVVAAFEAALAEGRGAFTLAGQMVDKPVVDRARRVLALDAAIRFRRGGQAHPAKS